MALFKKNECANPLGRKKGSFSKNKYRFDVAKMFAEEDFNPLKNLIRIAQRADNQKMEFECNKVLAKYFAPELRAVEHSGEINTHETLLELLDSRSNLSANEDKKAGDIDG